MRRKYFFATIAMIVMCVCGCGSSSQKMAETDAVPEENSATVEEAAEETPAAVETPVVEETPSPEDSFGEGYAYILGSADNPLLAFNCPYRPLMSVKRINDGNCWFLNERNSNEMRLIISVVPYHVIIGGEKIKFGDDTYEITDSEEIETANGKATIYFSPEVYDGGERGMEIAQLELDDGRKVYFELSYTASVHYGSSYKPDYQATLKEMLPILFEPVDHTDRAALNLQENSVPIDASYDIYLCEPETGYSSNSGTYQEDKMKPVLGINFDQLANNKWTDPRDAFYFMSGRGEKEGSSFDATYCISFYSHKQEGSIMKHLEVSTMENIYNYYFGEHSLFDIEEKAEVETPFGTAKIFYAEIELDGEKVEEEVAVLKNLQNTIVISYREDGEQSPYNSTYREDFNYNTYDGIYDGKLEELLPQLF